MPLRFVTFLAPNVLPVYQFIAAWIGQRLGIETELLSADTHDQYDSLHPDIAFLCGLPYVLMRRQARPVEALAAPVLIGERYGGRPIYFSDVIVKADAPFRTFVDLRGRSWAYNEKVSQSGYGVTRHHLIQMGATSGFFSQVVCAGWHQRAIRWVAGGQIDAAAIDSQVLAVELRDHPELAASIRVIDTFGPSTIQPVVARTDLPDSLKTDVQAAFSALADDPAARAVLSHGLFERFVPVADADYDDIRAMLDAAEAADYWIIR